MHRWAVRDSSSLVDAKPHPTILRRADNSNPPLVHSSTRISDPERERICPPLELKAGIQRPASALTPPVENWRFNSHGPPILLRGSWHQGWI